MVIIGIFELFAKLDYYIPCHYIETRAKMKKHIIVFLILLGSSNMSFGQNSYWKKMDSKQRKMNTVSAIRSDLGSSPTLYLLDTSKIKNVFAKVGTANAKNTRVEFPDANGNLLAFNVVQTHVMESELAAKYPNIKTYKGTSVDNKGTNLYISVTPLGVNGLIRDIKGNETFIDTYSVENSSYVVYRRGEQSLPESEFKCLVETSEEAILESQQRFAKSQAISDKTYRTYRLAMACTVEYAAFHINRAGVQAGSLQDKKEAVLSAMVVTMNRVNSIYEKDLAVHMRLINRNDELIFIDNDDFDNSSARQLISQSQRVINSIVGSAAYDIGHTVSTGGGGLAQLGVPCTPLKAMGITGSRNPIGDAYDIDYVAHEMGHQFGANHTFNNSSGGNVNRYTAFEPGSGSTIMGYAGISEPNVQQNSDGYFHAISIQEMQRVLEEIGTCAELDQSENDVPVVDAGGDYILPVGTPFVLKGKASGKNANMYTYTWEQMDNEFSVQPPVSTAKMGPNFRSITPSTSPNRYMPTFNDVLEGRISNTWEVVPTVARSMKFNLTVRNSVNPLGGQIGMDNVILYFIGTDPFIITSLGDVNEQGIVDWEEKSKQTITWNVVNTNQPEIGTAHVNILYSKDNGANFKMLLENIPNSGTATITVPAGITDEARIMIEPVDNIYYALSQKINILEASFDNNIFVLYPNPNDGEFRIRFAPESKGDINIDVFDMTGKLVYNNVFSNEKEFDKVVSASFLNSGVYIVKVNDGGKKIERKIVIK